VQVIENKLVQAREILRLCNKKSPNYIELDYEMESKINNYKYNRKGCDITKWI
jgi:hypothetical protein